MVKRCVFGVEVCNDVRGYVVIKEGGHVGVGDVCVGSGVCRCYEEGTVLCVKFRPQKVREPPSGDPLVP